MRSEQIISKMNNYLHQAANVLVAWLSSTLPRVTDNWWEECVLDSLSYIQRDAARENRFSELSEFDLAALLRIADRSWYSIQTLGFIPDRERECIREMRRVRNNWAHVSATLPGKDVIIDDLNTLYQFFEQRECGMDLLNDVIQMIEYVRAPSADISFATPAVNVPQTEPSVSANSDDIHELSEVYLVSSPDTHGLVMSVADMGDKKKYQVFIEGVQKTFFSGQIALVEKQDEFKWLDSDEFRSYLTAYQINNPSATNLYSLNAARIDFVPYQFRPALKLIHADEPRILIADSVGVGKTIEAGLIVKELQARYEMDNILIICPKPLVAERKWEMEMKRFDEDFVPLNGSVLRELLSTTHRDGEWPVRYNKAIIPYSILDGRAYEGEVKRNGKTYGLMDLDPAPHFDLVIVDEAHHIRNGSMEKEKAFEYKCVKYFCDHADAVVMLSATPLQTSDDDLYTLLNVLRPDVVIDKSTFATMAKPNASISEASSLVRRADDNWQENTRDALENVLGTQWGESVIAPNPLYGEIIKQLEKPALSREERVKMITDIESLHSFNTMLNRTRRKDIQDFCIRRSYTIATEFTPEQQELHDALLVFEQNALLQLHGSARTLPFMMSTIKRQAASCIFGLAPHVRDMIDRRFAQLDEDYDGEGYVFSGQESEVLENLASNLLLLADNLPEEDPKFDKMMEKIMGKQTLENNKIILFSTFRFTLAYLKKKLQEAGLRVAQVDGSVKDILRQEYRARFELPKDNEDAIDIMLFTEVGSEGLDYQFCDMMINYDLPWNPMRIEQRIGRIDRRGQMSESVGIYNMITDGTVDADIYYRCLLRIGIFENSIGECDEILGDIATDLERIGMDPTLTEEERQKKLEQMADNEVRKLQELNRLEEEEKELFGFDLSEHMTSKEIQKAESPWISPKNLQIMVEQYLLQLLGKGTYFLGEGDLKQLRLSYDARQKLREEFLALPGGRNAIRQNWEHYLKGREPIHAITFESETANRYRNAFFITATHPLVKQAAAHFASSDQAYIRLEYSSDELPEGEYKFSVYAWSYAGLRPHFRMAVVCDDGEIAEELPSILQEAQANMAPVTIDPSNWETLEEKHFSMWSEEKGRTVDDAAKTAAYKLGSLSNSYDIKKRSLEQRIADATDERILRMLNSELENATERYETKVAEIKQKVEQTDIHTTLIANGLLEIVS